MSTSNRGASTDGRQDYEEAGILHSRIHEQVHQPAVAGNVPLQLEDNSSSTEVSDRLPKPTGSGNDAAEIPSINQKQPSFEEDVLPTVGPMQTAIDRTVNGLLPWSQDALPLYRKLSKLQDRFFTVQTQLNSKRDDLRPKLNHLEQSLSSLLQLLGDANDGMVDNSGSKERQEAHVLFSEDRESLELHIKAVNDLEQRLSTLEYKIAKMQPKLLQIIESYFYNESQDDESTTSSDSSYSIIASPTLISLEQRYYERRGEVRLLQDELLNHLADFRKPSDDAIRPHDAIGETQRGVASRLRWRDEFDRIWNDLRIAEQQLSILWRECQTAELDVGTLDLQLPVNSEAPEHARATIHRAGEFHAPPFWPSSYLGALPSFLQGISWPRSGSRIGSRMAEIIEFATKQNFIKDWVGGMPTSPMEFEPSSSRSEPDWCHVTHADAVPHKSPRTEY